MNLKVFKGEVGEVVRFLSIPKGLGGKNGNFKTTFVVGANKVSQILLWHNRTQRQKTAGNIG